jgi:uncharacterized integral membrane protein (TIGR00697 family)
MYNELILLSHSIIIGIATLSGLFLGVEALTTLICLYCVLANLCVIKQITVCTLNATCTDAFTIGATLGLNVLQEYYGKQAAQRAIVINFFILLVYMVMSHIHLWYMPNVFDQTQLHFTALFSCTPRIVIASSVVYFMTQTLDYYVYGFLKTCWSNRYLIVRNCISIMISQLFDTVAFTFLGLYGVVQELGQLIIVSYTIKIVAVMCSTPYIALSKYVMKQRKSDQS